MIEFQELEIELKETEAVSVIIKIENILDKGIWKRNKKSEIDLNKMSDSTQFCFDYYVDSQLYAKLWIAGNEVVLLVKTI
jgi:hypothetical protein